MNRLLLALSLWISCTASGKYYSTNPNHTFPLQPGHINTRILQQDALQSLYYAAPFANAFWWGPNNTPPLPGHFPLRNGLLSVNALPASQNLSLHPIAIEDIEPGDLVIFESHQSGYPPQLAIFSGNDQLFTIPKEHARRSVHNMRYSRLINDNRIIGVYRLFY